MSYDVESPGVIKGDFARWKYALAYRYPAVERRTPDGARPDLRRLCREAS